MGTNWTIWTGADGFYARAAPAELHHLELPRLAPLPAVLPKVCEIHEPMVDREGMVHLRVNRHSAPAELLGRRVAARESKDAVRLIADGQAAAVRELAGLDFIGKAQERNNQRVRTGRLVARAGPAAGNSAPGGVSETAAGRNGSHC